MNQYYPAIFYPRLILKFLASNPTSSLKFHRNDKEVKLSKKKDNYSDRILNKIYYLLICINSFIFVYLYSLSLYPFWLIASIWVSINFSCWCFISNFFNKRNNNHTISTQVKTKRDNTVPIRLPQRETDLYHYLKGKVLQPLGESDAPAGVSEKRFFQLTKRIFPNITQGVAFHNPNFPHPYSADFLIVHPSGLSIDIEIDEPYIGNTKEPHHCIDQGKDDIRNQFFTQNNWVVIRFSEKQTVKYPYSCCKAIAEVIARVSGDFTFLRKLNNVPTLTPESMWTIKQAKKWAKEDYRRTYLQ